MEDNLDISVVIPAYNEEKRLPATLEKIIRYLETSSHNFEIIVVDDGSSDNTRKIVTEYMNRCRGLVLLCNPKKNGKGSSVRAGILAAKGKYIFFSDADLSTPIEEIEKLLFYLRNGYQVVFGSRALSGSQIIIREAWYRDKMGKIFGFLMRHAVLPGIRDSQCGFKGFHKDIISSLFNIQRINGFAFDVEILFIARKLGLSMKEVPVRWLDSPKSKVNPILDSPKMLFDLIKIHWNNLNRKYSFK